MKPITKIIKDIQKELTLELYKIRNGDLDWMNYKIDGNKFDRLTLHSWETDAKIRLLDDLLLKIRKTSSKSTNTEKTK